MTKWSTRLPQSWRSDHAGSGERIIAFVVRARSALASVEQALAHPAAGKEGHRA